MNIIVDGRYQIIKRLGKGGFAHTYLAKNLTAPGEPTCVVKQLRPKIAHPRMLQLFHLEAKILGRFKHSQIPQTQAYFEHEGDFFLVQDFVAGDDLSKEFMIGHQWSESKVIQFLRELLQVVGYVHQKRAIHRDIKPANIIRHWDTDQLCLIDFGAVKDLNNESATVAVVGTPGYAPPEQIDGAATFGSDIYAVGMTAIQFLSGQYPLHLPKDENGQVLWRDLTQISDKLGLILDRMVQVHETDRYQCTSAVLVDLEELVTTENKLKDLSADESIDRSSDRLTHKIMAGMAILGLGILSAVSISAHLPIEPVGVEDKSKV
jgi:eukaryotic-like serine/threonine-protein kinase